MLRTGTIQSLVWGLLAFNINVQDSYQADSAPSVSVKNGTYVGVYAPTYDQDFFLGMPFAQPPVGELRFQVPQPLNSSWTDSRNATQYSPECIGYGSDDWVLGNDVSEDCLTINVIRPTGTEEDAKLPIGVWIYGGGYFEGGSSDPRYNLSYIVQQSVKMGKPMLGVSLNYRVSEWGFLFSKELLNAGATNLGLRDQRLALHWVQENIAAFGGDPAKVTIWGESAGAFSVAMHLVAYGGRDDGLFRGAIQESGSASLGGRIPNLTTAQPVYDAVINAVNCSQASDTLACLRTIPSDALSAVFNSSVTQNFSRSPIIDGDFLQSSGTTQLRNGQFVKVPLLAGANFDEGSSFGTQGINTTQQFISDVTSDGLDNATALTMAAVYPDIPEIGIPATLHGRPPPANLSYGYQWKRAAAYGGDLIMHAPRRLTSQMWAMYNQSMYSYHFNVATNGFPDLAGSVHFQEVAFVFDNTGGMGYENVVAVDPFANEPATFDQLADIMSRMWVSFITDLDPNESGATTVQWPKYCLDNPQNIVFDVNSTNLAYVENDIYRAEGIAYISSLLDNMYGR